MTKIHKSLTCIWETNTIKTKRLISMLIPSTTTNLAQDILQTRLHHKSDIIAPPTLVRLTPIISRIHASYVAMASIGETPRPLPVLSYAKTRKLLCCLRNEHPASPHAACAQQMSGFSQCSPYN